MRLKNPGLSFVGVWLVGEYNLPLPDVLVVILSLPVGASECLRARGGCVLLYGFSASTSVEPVMVATLSRLLSCCLKLSIGTASADMLGRDDVIAEV